MPAKATTSEKRDVGPETAPEVAAGRVEVPEKWSVRGLAHWLQIPERTVNTMMRDAKVIVAPENFRRCIIAVIEHYARASARFDSRKAANEARITAARANKEEREEAMAAGELCYRSDVLATYADSYAELARLIKNFDGMSQAAKERLGREVAKLKMGKIEAAK